MFGSLGGRFRRWIESDPGSVAAAQKWLSKGNSYPSPKSTTCWELQDDKQKDQCRRAFSLAETEPSEAFRVYRELADAGSFWGMERAGWHLAKGIGTTRDVTEAKRYFGQAFDGRSDFAATWLGLIYADEGSLARAEESLRSPVSDDYAPAMHLLAVAYVRLSALPEHRKAARELLERAARLGYMPARTDLTRFLLHGRFGVLGIATGVRQAVGFVREMSSEFDQAGSDRTGTIT